MDLLPLEVIFLKIWEKNWRKIREKMGKNLETIRINLPPILFGTSLPLGGNFDLVGGKGLLL